MDNLAEGGNLGKAVSLAEDIRNAMARDEIVNENRYQHLKSLQTLYFNVAIGKYVADSGLDFRSALKSVFDDLASVTTALYGQESTEWMDLQAEFAIYYANVDVDMEKSAFHLCLPFEQAERPFSKIYELCLVYFLSKNYPLFDYVGLDESYLKYAGQLVDLENIKVDDCIELWSGIANAYSGIDKTVSIKIYLQLSERAKAVNAFKEQMAFLRRAAAQTQFSGDYRTALEYYKTIRNWYFAPENAGAVSPDMIASSLASMAYCAKELADRQEFEAYRAEAIKYYQVANSQPNISLDDKIYNIQEIATLKELSFDNIFGNWNAALDDYKEILRIADTSGSDTEQSNNCKWGAHHNLSLRYAALEDIESALYHASQALTLVTDTLDYRYSATLEDLGRAYFRSIEPELSSDYFYNAALLSEYRVLAMVNTLSAAQKETEYEALIHLWERCADNLFYLGEVQSAVDCLEHQLKIVSMAYGADSPEYRMYEMQRCDKIARFYAQYINIAPPNSALFKYVRNENADLTEVQKALGAKAQLLFQEKPTAEALYDLALDYSVQGQDSVQCITYLQKAIEIAQQENPQSFVLDEVYNDATEYLARNQGPKILLDCYKRQEHVYAGLSDKREKYFQTLANIARTYRILGESHLTEVYYEKALVLADSCRMEAADLLALDYARFLFDNGKYDKLLPLYSRATGKWKERLLAAFQGRTAQEREKTWLTEGDFPIRVGELLKSYSAVAIDDAMIYDNLLFRKNILLNTSINAVNLIKASGDTLLLRKFERVNALKQRSAIGEDSIEVSPGRMLPRIQLQRLINKLEYEVIARSQMLDDVTVGLECSWQEVQRALSEGQLAVEFSRYQDIDGISRYGAVALGAQGTPVFIPLCEEKLLLQIRRKESVYTEPDLARLIWQPILSRFEHITTVYFAPDGELHNMPIEFTAGFDAETPMSEMRKMYRLSSTRQLTLKKGESQFCRAILYGGLKYDMDSKQIVDDAEVNRYLRDFTVENNPAVGDSILLRGGVEYLPATRKETEEIRIMLDANEIETELFSDFNGTEASFKRLSGQLIPIIHIATHGFYWPETVTRNRRNPDFMESEAISNGEDRALMRSGLLMSGANYTLKGKKLPGQVDDGILTAREISQMDLRGLDMVALSACQTGLGDIGGDGVFGLQRGFKKAGAGTLLMSLWKVADQATQLLMTEFYKKYLSGMGKRAALIEAQKYVRNYEQVIRVKQWNRQAPVTPQEREEYRKAPVVVRTVKPYAEPRYWAAFVLLDALD
ncbi:MAG: CHAT domain-containing protein [Alistipes sp.]|nr:CHAT domain-containing protein [Alistipes sp.]